MAKGFNLKAIFSADTKDIERGSTIATESVKKFEKESNKALDSFAGHMQVAGAKANVFSNNITKMAGRFAGALLSVQAISSAVRKLNGFEEANSKLAAVLGTTTKGVESLSKAAMDLGKRTQYTASEVTELQTELAKLGFTESEIKATQEPVLKFAAAVGTDLASAAARAGATMRGFGLNAKETGDMLSVMAVSTSRSALSFGYLDETLGKLVPVTRAFGLDTRSTIALLGTLANAGIDASSAQTALRRIMLELSNSSSKLNTALGKQPKTMEDIIAALKKLKEGNMGLEQSFDFVGQKAASVFLALVNGADDCDQLYGELEDVDGKLDEMYKTMTDNVTGAVKELQSAWEGFILKLQNSKGILRDMIQLATDVVNLISGEGGFKKQRQKREAEAYANRRMTGEGDISYKGFGGMRDREIDAYLVKLEEDLDHFKENHIWNKVRDLEDELAIARLAAPIAKERNKQARNPQLYGGNSTVVEDEDDSGEDDKNKKKADGLRQLTAAAREYAAAQKEVMDADAEMDALAAQMLSKFDEEHPVIDKTTSSLVGLSNQVAYLVGINQDYNGVLGDISQSLSDVNAESIKLAVALEDEVTSAVEQIQEEWAENFDKMQRRTQEFADGIRSLLGGALTSTFSDLGTFIGDSLTGGENAMQDFSTAMLSTFGDMCIKLGELIITASGALEAIQAALEFSENPWIAAAAGAALIAVGAAVKAGAANIARGGGYSSSSVSSSYGTSGRTSDYASREFTVNVTGTLVANGSQLVAVLNNENKRKQLTT